MGKIITSDAGRMLSVETDDGLIAVTGGEGATTNLLLSTSSGEASIDIEPAVVEGLTECFLAWNGRDVVLVERETLNALIAATTGAVEVLEMMHLGTELRRALIHLTKQVGAE